MTTRGPDWRADPYFLSSAPKCLVTLFGGEHSLGGVSGYDAEETTDADPGRVAAIQRLTWGYLRTALYPEDTAWSSIRSAMATAHDPLAKVECR